MSDLGIKSLLQNHSLSSKNLWIKIYFLVTMGLFLFRVVVFAAHYGSIEHDSGWFLGVAKNLAQRGIYASYINTIEEEGSGAHPSVRRGVSLQDENGFSYFPTGVTVGPGYVFPQALLLKIFGDGWWQYRLWPLTAYGGLLFFLFYFVWLLGGLWALIIFQLWLWAIPQITTTLAYEAFSEPIALFYLLAGYFLFLRTFESEKEQALIFLSGCFLSLAVLTKLLFLLALSGFAPIALWEAYTRRHESKKILRKWMVFFAGFIFPVLLFQIYRCTALIPTFGIEGWKTILKNNLIELTYGGSGIPYFKNYDWSFMRQKLMVWPDVAMKDSAVLWVLFLISPLLMIGRIEKRNFILVLLMYCAALMTFLWFVFVSQFGWTRHAWHALLLAMMLMSAGLGVTLRANIVDWNKESILSLLVIILAITMVVKFDRVEMRLLLDNKTIDKWLVTRSYRHLGISLLGLPHAAIFSLDDQRDTVEFFKEKIHKEDRIYYVNLFFVSEIATLADKVFYPINRYFNNNCQNPEGGKSYLIIGPYQQGRWSFTTDNYARDTVATHCDNTVFANKSYTICSLKECISSG